MLPDCKIGNFTSNWNSGIALAALLDYCRPGLFPDWQRLRPENGKRSSYLLLFSKLFVCSFAFQSFPVDILFADEVNKLFSVKPSALSVQTTSSPLASRRNNIYIFASNAFQARNPSRLPKQMPPHQSPSNDDHFRSGELQTRHGHRGTGVQDPAGAHIVPTFKPSHCPNFQTKNVTKTEQVLEPEHFASPHLDELSGMTYLSYFMKVTTISMTMMLTPNLNFRRRTALATTQPSTG